MKIANFKHKKTVSSCETASFLFVAKVNCQILPFKANRCNISEPCNKPL